MRILIICKALENSFVGGIQTHVSALTHELMSKGHSVTLLTAGNTAKDKSDLGFNKSVNIVKLKYIPRKLALGMKHSFGEISFNLSAMYWVYKNQNQFDLVHIQGRSGIMLPLLKLRVPIICTVHRLMLIEQQWNKSEYSNVLDRTIHQKWCKYFEKTTLHKSDEIIAVSKSTAEEIYDFLGFKKNIRIIPNGVTIPKIEATKKQDTLLFVGRLSEVKGLPTLIKAMSFVKPSINLKIVGTGPDSQAVENIIHSLKLNDRVTLLGKRSKEEVYQLMSSSRALVLPSFHESQGIVLLEANAHGIPVIATNISGITEFVINGVNGLLFEKGHPIELSEKINKIYEDRALAQSLGNAGRAKMIESYDWKYIGEATIDIYKQVA